MTDEERKRLEPHFRVAIANAVASMALVQKQMDISGEFVAWAYVLAGLDFISQHAEQQAYDDVVKLLNGEVKTLLDRRQSILFQTKYDA